MTSSSDALSPGAAPPKGAMGTLFLIVLTDLLGFGIIIPALPFYAKAYAASALAVTLLFSVYSVCQLVGTPVLGAISDRKGRRPVLIFSQAGSVIGYALLGVATIRPWSAPVALTMIYLSRVIDGFSGGNISTAQAYISDITTDETRAKGMGMLGAAFGIGFTLGPFLGGVLAGHDNEHPSWPAFAAAACSAIATIMSYFRLPEPPVHKGHAGGSWAFGVLKGRPVLAQLILISFLCMAAFVMMESSFALFLSRDDTFQFSARQVGYCFGLAGLAITIVQGGLVGRLTKRLGEWPLAIGGPLLVAGGMVCFTIVGIKPIYSILFLGIVINATGRSLQQPVVSSLISKFGARHEQGALFGLYHGLLSLARVIGPIVAGLIYERYATGPYITAGAIVLVAAVWTISVRATAPKENPIAKEPAAIPEV